MKEFYKYHSVEVLQYLGRAYYRAGKYKEAKTIFLKVGGEFEIISYELISV